MGVRVVIGLAAALFVSAPVGAQASQIFERNAVAGCSPPVGIASAAPLAGNIKRMVRFSTESFGLIASRTCHIVMLYRVPVPSTETNKTPAPTFVARLHLRDGATGNWREGWATSGACPALVKALETLGAVVTPNFTEPRRAAAADTMPTETGKKYTFMAEDTLSSSGVAMDPYTLTISGYETSNIAVWIDATLKSLETCWTAEHPADL